MSIYVDFHVLQTVPPSCVNRDDTGSPKTAVYGGFRQSESFVAGVEACHEKGIPGHVCGR